MSRGVIQNVAAPITPRPKSSMPNAMTLTATRVSSSAPDPGMVIELPALMARAPWIIAPTMIPPMAMAAVSSAMMITVLAGYRQTASR